MRLDNAMLLLSSLSLVSLLPLNVVALPIRIVIVEKVPIDDIEAFMRSVRVGHAAAAGANFDGLPSRPIDALEETDDTSDVGPIRILPFFPEADSLPSADNEDENASTTAPVAIPMTPADESDIPTWFDFDPFTNTNPGGIEEYKQAQREQCEAQQNSWKSKFGRVENWFREMFGLSTIAARSVDCEQWAESTSTPPGPIVRPPMPVTPAPEDFAAEMAQSHREMCEKEKQEWRWRMGRASAWVREHLGLEVVHEDPGICYSPLIRPALPRPTNIPPALHRVSLANSFPVPPPTVVGGKPCHTNSSGPVNSLGAPPIPPSGPRFRRPGYWRPRTFTGRLQKALYSLSPWEGRALAFVLGCGLGVLIRMVYVFILLGVRAWRCRKLKRDGVQLSEDSDVQNNSWQTESIVDAVILFDAASIKSLSRRASMESFNEKLST